MPQDEPSEEPSETVAETSFEPCQPAPAPLGAFCLRRADRDVTALGTLERLSVSVVATEPAKGGCWSNGRWPSAGSAPERSVRMQLRDDDEVEWELELDEESALDEVEAGDRLALGVTMESGNYWMRESLRIDDDDGLRLALGSSLEGVTITRAGQGTCTVPGRTLPCPERFYHPQRIAFEGIAVTVRADEVVEREGYQVAGYSADVAMCAWDGPATDRFMRIVRLP